MIMTVPMARSNTDYTINSNVPSSSKCNHKDIITMAIKGKN